MTNLRPKVLLNKLKLLKRFNTMKYLEAPSRPVLKAKPRRKSEGCESDLRDEMKKQDIEIAKSLMDE